MLDFLLHKKSKAFPGSWNNYLRLIGNACLIPLFLGLMCTILDFLPQNMAQGEIGKGIMMAIGFLLLWSVLGTLIEAARFARKDQYGDPVSTPLHTGRFILALITLIIIEYLGHVILSALDIV